VVPVPAAAILGGLGVVGYLGVRLLRNRRSRRR